MKTPLLALAGPTSARTRPLAWAGLAVLIIAAMVALTIRACSGARNHQEALGEYQQDQQRIQQSPPAPLTERQQEHLRSLQNH